MTACPLCLSIDGFGSADKGTWCTNNMRHECEVCGTFGTTWEARDDYLGAERIKTSPFVRAALSHWTRRHQAIRNQDDIPLVTSDLINAAISSELPMPSPGEQATNIVRFVGEETKLTGKSLASLPPEFHAIVGSICREFSVRLLLELVDDGLLVAKDASSLNGFDALAVRLTLRGWERFESEQKGKTAGNYGFLALKFGDEVLDPFVQSHIKPAVAELGFELRDMRDGARAGVIDNLMRIDIRDAAFVIADLTHDNAGSYWEAGYAEGLGKPVLYICEKSKFDAVKTHFDTNHSTTVQWDVDDSEAFKRDLIATLRRSLIL